MFSKSELDFFAERIIISVIHRGFKNRDYIKRCEIKSLGNGYYSVSLIVKSGWVTYTTHLDNQFILRLDNLNFTKKDGIYRFEPKVERIVEYFADRLERIELYNRKLNLLERYKGNDKFIFPPKIEVVSMASGDWIIRISNAESQKVYKTLVETTQSMERKYLKGAKKVAQQIIQEANSKAKEEG